MRGLLYNSWCPASQGAGTPCRVRGRACGGHGCGGAVAPAPVLGSHQQILPRRTGVTIWGAAGRDLRSVWRVLMLVVASAVVLPLLPCRLTYEVCLADGNGGIR